MSQHKLRELPDGDAHVHTRTQLLRPRRRRRDLPHHPASTGPAHPDHPPPGRGVTSTPHTGGGGKGAGKDSRRITPYDEPDEEWDNPGPSGPMRTPPAPPVPPLRETHGRSDRREPYVPLTRREVHDYFHSDDEVWTDGDWARWRIENPRPAGHGRIIQIDPRFLSIDITGVGYDDNTGLGWNRSIDFDEISRWCPYTVLGGARRQDRTRTLDRPVQPGVLSRPVIQLTETFARGMT